jgi:hypothetical protein
MSILEWKRPTISIFRERIDKPENEPFAVIKAKKLSIEEVEGGGFKGDLTDFFSIMGDFDYISSDDGRKDHYVLCWFDDVIEDFNESFRRLTGVTFPAVPSYTVSAGKRTYKASFQAKQGKVR